MEPGLLERPSGGHVLGIHLGIESNHLKVAFEALEKSAQDGGAGAPPPGVSVDSDADGAHCGPHVDSDVSHGLAIELCDPEAGARIRKTLCEPPHVLLWI